MSTKLSAYMGGLGIDARDKLEVLANATVTVGDGATLGNVHVGDGGKFIAGADDDLVIAHSGSAGTVDNLVGDLTITNSADDKDIILQSDDGSGGTEVYFRADGSASESIVYFSGNEHFKTQQTGVKATGNVDVTANIGVSGNVFVGSYISIANTNPAATDSLVIGGNVRITSGSLIFPDGSTQSSGSGITTFPTGDYGLLDAANSASDAFGQVTGGLTTFDMLTSPTGSVDTQDLGALT
tara:strand:+ start:820 stop:1539 length:720 start_codon:yes stop_codon:yes gene_type:complete